jgi:hypothetical protein
MQHKYRLSNFKATESSDSASPILAQRADEDAQHHHDRYLGADVCCEHVFYERLNSNAAISPRFLGD